MPEKRLFSRFSHRSLFFLIACFLARSGLDSLAAPFWFDQMNYAVGNIYTNSGGLWLRHSGTSSDSLAVSYTGSPVAVSGNRYEVNQGRQDDVHRLFFADTNGFDYTSPLSLYASFTVSLTNLPANSGGTYFAHFMGTNFDYAARAYALTAGAYPGTWRLGVANAQLDYSSSSPSNTGPSTVVPIDLAQNTDYQVVVRYTPATFSSTIWINPASESDTANSATATDPEAFISTRSE